MQHLKLSRDIFFEKRRCKVTYLIITYFISCTITQYENLHVILCIHFLSFENVFYLYREKEKEIEYNFLLTWLLSSRNTQKVYIALPKMLLSNLRLGCHTKQFQTNISSYENDCFVVFLTFSFKFSCVRNGPKRVDQRGG